MPYAILRFEKRKGGLIILFFTISIFKSTANFRDFRRPEQALRYFISYL